MWEADEAWRRTLRGVRLSDLTETLSKEIPPEIWEKSFEWVLDRAG
ncbi:hypothetical protein Brsp01_42970 [Brucella sp. NBRC 12950]|nr:hypothetical protein Brsp01_42970 [Brucella sp. NBRC 12950]